MDPTNAETTNGRRTPWSGDPRVAEASGGGRVGFVLASRLPDWVSRPAGALAVVAAVAGSGLIFWATVSGSYLAAILGGVAFFAAGLFWYAADLAAGQHPLR